MIELPVANENLWTALVTSAVSSRERASGLRQSSFGSGQIALAPVETFQGHTQPIGGGLAELLRYCEEPVHDRTARFVITEPDRQAEIATILLENEAALNERIETTDKLGALGLSPPFFLHATDQGLESRIASHSK